MDDLKPGDEAHMLVFLRKLPCKVAGLVDGDKALVTFADGVQRVVPREKLQRREPPSIGGNQLNSGSSAP